MERARAWAEAKAKEKARITRIASEDREKAELEADDRVREKANPVQRSAAEAATMIRAKADSD